MISKPKNSYPCRTIDLLTDEGIQHLRANPPQILSRAEVCAWLGISERSLRNYEARGWFPVVKIGRRRLYRRDAIMHAPEGMEVGGEI